MKEDFMTKRDEIEKRIVDDANNLKFTANGTLKGALSDVSGLLGVRGVPGPKAVPTKGDRVSYIGDRTDGKIFPHKGVFGTVLALIGPKSALVEWDEDTGLDRRWYCPIGELKIEEVKDAQ